MGMDSVATAPGSGRPWDLHLIESVAPGSLVEVARGRRLAVAEEGVLRRVDLNWVDEVALALVDCALARNHELVLVYPAPAGKVAILLAAQILVRYFVSGGRKERVGLVTASPADAAKHWKSLRFLPPRGDRVPLDDVFPIWRARPDGSLPQLPRDAVGAIVGQRVCNWGVRATVVDHLIGPVWGIPNPPAVHIIADPMDPLIQEAFDKGVPVWGWSDSSLAALHGKLGASAPGTVPFSIAHGRLAVMAAGVRVQARVCPHPGAAAALLRLREDLAVLRQTAGADPPHHVAAGLRVAWAYASTLAGLPVRPSRYDRHATGPPRAARPTHEFAPEIRAWARTLDSDFRDFAEVVASDLEDLRLALEEDNPLLRAVAQVGADVPAALIVLRTRTAERALKEELGDGFAGETATVRSLYLQESRPHALLTGPPPRAAWPHLEGGLAPLVEVGVLGDEEATVVARAQRQLRVARARWASIQVRRLAWRALVGSEPPPPPAEPAYADEQVEVEALTGPAAIALRDPFSPLGEVLADDRPLLGESQEERVARPLPDGTWAPDTDAVAVVTQDGTLLVPPERLMDRMVAGDRLESAPATDLEPGDRIVLGRREGRLRLVEALEERMRDRPDLWTAHLLVEEFRESVSEAFTRSRQTVAGIHAAMRAKGSDISRGAVATWLHTGDVMGPQQTDDLRTLGEVLDIPVVRSNLSGVRAALGRIRGFRRAAGRALARAASAAVTVTPDDEDVEKLGIDIEDLREAVLVTTVVEVKALPHRVPWSEVGRLVVDDD